MEEQKKVKENYILNGTYETRVSTKKGTEYTALFIKLNKDSDYEKIVFLSTAEVEILRKNR